MMLRRVFLATVVVGVAAVAYNAQAADDKAFTDPAKAGPDFAVQGEYLGELKNKNGESAPFAAQVIALGDGKFHAVFYLGGLPGEGWYQGGLKLDLDSKTEDGVIVFAGEQGSGKIKDGKMVILSNAGDELGTLEKTTRKSPTLGAKPPEGARVLFDGKDAKDWVDGKIVEGNLLLAGTRTKDDFQDFTFHMEFRTPFVPAARGQARGNSGLYLQNRYECQVLDSFGLEGENNECGGFYQIRKPDVNMCFPPLSWQTYDIDFTAARFEGDKKVKNAVVTIKHNGVVIHDKFELPNLTPGGAPAEAPGKGPFLLQAHGNPVTYQNIWVVEKKS